MPSRRGFNNWIVVAACATAMLTVGCRLFDDTADVVLNPSDADVGHSPDANASTTDVRPHDVGPDAMPDMASATDASVDMGTDAGLVIDPATVFDLIRDEVCDYYERQDYHGSVFLGVGFRDRAGCIAFFDVFLRNLVGMLARDVELGRAVLNEETARAIVNHVRTYQGDPRVFPISDVAGLVTPLGGLGSACSSTFACVSTPSVAATCHLANATDCDGVCVESAKVCAGVVCGANEWCLQGNCVAEKVDGEACGNDVQCINRCVSGLCDTLATGADCTANPADCGADAYCKTSVDPNQCAPIGILNDACTQDEGCAVGHYCDATTSRCKSLGEGTPCRLGVCGAGLNCVATSATDATLRCFAPRAADESCTVDKHCAAGNYCNLNICTAAKAVGAPCRLDRECESICRFANSDDTVGACAKFKWGLAAGDACHVKAQVCGMGMECETTGTTVLSGVCVVQTRPAIGEACEATRPFWCADDNVCVDGACKAMLPSGATCAIDEDCRSSVCDGTCFDRVDACVVP